MARALKQLLDTMAATLLGGRVSRSSGIPIEQDEESSDSRSDVIMRCITDGYLNATSQLDEFRVLFDLKTEHWSQFRDFLKTEVEDYCSWSAIRIDEKQRRICANKFLEKYGHRYWGSYENRCQYLDTKGIENNKTCIYPKDLKALIAGLEFLLEKARRASERDSTAAARPAESGGSAMGSSAETNNNKPAPSKKTKTSKKAQAQPSDILSGLQEATNREKGTDATTKQVPAGQRATYFLVRNNISNQLSPVCVPFGAYESSTDFIDKLAAKCLTTEERALKMQSYAVVTLLWSKTKTPFLVRPDTDDLHALMDRLCCAWAAQEQGKLEIFEFEVEVMLHFEVKKARA